MYPPPRAHTHTHMCCQLGEAAVIVHVTCLLFYTEAVVERGFCAYAVLVGGCGAGMKLGSLDAFRPVCWEKIMACWNQKVAKYVWHAPNMVEVAKMVQSGTNSVQVPYSFRRCQNSTELNCQSTPPPPRGDGGCEAAHRWECSKVKEMLRFWRDARSAA